MKTNRRTLVGGIVLLIALMMGGLGVVLAQAPPGPADWSQGWRMGGPGMMGGGGGMMGGGGGMMNGPGMMGGRGAGAGASSDATRWFIEEMIPHHEDAVAMADLALTRAEHQEIKDLAVAIKTSQTREIEQMRAWYRQWYGAAPPAGQMPHRWDARALTSAPSFDRAFIEQMVPHHQMAVMMASMALPRVEQPEMRQLLLAIIGDQSREISSMGQWYRAWYGGPVPGMMGGGMMGGGMMGGGMMGGGGSAAGCPAR